MADEKPVKEAKLEGFELVVRPAQPAAQPPPKRMNEPEEVSESGDRFVTRLQLLLTYVSKIGSLALSTSVTNDAVLLSLLTELIKASRQDDAGVIAYADVKFNFEGSDGELKSYSMTGNIKD